MARFWGMRCSDGATLVLLSVVVLGNILFLKVELDPSQPGIGDIAPRHTNAAPRWSERSSVKRMAFGAELNGFALV